jgi:aminopeptidase-like protein
MYALIERLYPICRSITGDGVRQTFEILKEFIALDIVEVPTGTPVFDWQIPKEWNIRDAYIKDKNGRRVVDFQANNLHVVGYSVPVHRKMRLAELRPHLFSLPEHPDWIPNRTSYYFEDWGFCLTHNQLLRLKDDEYEICIDSRLEHGSLTYGEYFIPGATADEVLIYTHTCHPSLCNDNLSGLALTTYLARELSTRSMRYSYRFVFGPTTIGSITWLAKNEPNLSRIKHGLVTVLVGDKGPITYKQSRQGRAEIDRIMAHVLKHRGKPHTIEAFSPYGYDERQFCSPGIDLPVGRFTRTPHNAYPEYHTSADNLDLVGPDALVDSYETCLQAIGVLERNQAYLNRNPKCEPQLGRRGLYSKTSGRVTAGQRQMAVLWVLNLSDGKHTLLEIAERSGLDFHLIDATAQALTDCGLLESVTWQGELK